MCYEADPNFTPEPNSFQVLHTSKFLLSRTEPNPWLWAKPNHNLNPK